jgi:hypothetical protein
MKLITPSLEQAQGHYDDLKTKPFYPGLTTVQSEGGETSWEHHGTAGGDRTASRAEWSASEFESFRLWCTQYARTIRFPELHASIIIYIMC